jgi:hypothetical protein
VSSAGLVGSRVSSEVGGGVSGPSSLSYVVIAGGFGDFGPKVGFYRRSPKASRSARKLYATRFAFYSQ